jgi:taurine dioxygenase
MAFKITPSGQACGAEVCGVDLAGPLDEATVAEIRQAWLGHKVLAFPDQHMTDDDLERFTLHFGPFGDDPFFESIDGHPHIAAIHRAAAETAPVFAESWHADWTFQEFPPDGTCLYGKVIPPVGGDTQFVNQELALARMPLGLRDRIEGLVAVHSAQRAYAPDGVYGETDDEPRAMKIVVSDEAYATQTHPLVRTHPETGAATLYSTFGYIIGIEGMEESEANELLGKVHAWQTREEFRYCHRWQPDMLVMWDNRTVLHRATGGYDGHERLLHRTTIGYNPLSSPESSSRG